MATIADLGREKYISITTFKRDGTAVSTPVWVAGEDGHLLVHSAASSWKVKRIRRDPHVRVAPCTGTGKVRGEPLDARARIVPEIEPAQELLARKYGLVYALIHGFGVASRWVRRKPEPESVTIEITAAPAV